MTRSGLILVGVVGAPHGVRGENRVKSFTVEPLAIAGYAPLLSDDGHRQLVVETARALKDDLVVVRFRGIASRDAAAVLTGTRLHVDRANLPEADEEEFYHADLLGLSARAGDGVTLGRIVAVQNHGAGDLLEIDPGTGPTILIAFTRAFVPRVDVAGGTVEIAPEALATNGREVE